MTRNMTVNEFLNEVNAGRTDFTGACITGRFPSGTKLENLCLNRSVFSDVHMQYMLISNCDFSESRFCTSHILNTDLFSCRLKYCTIRYSCINLSQLTKCDFTSADLHRSALTNSTILDSKLDHVLLNSSTLVYTFVDECSFVFDKYGRMELLTLLGMDWQLLPPELTTECMKWDAMSHPNPSMFSKWADYSGRCPYANIPVQRLIQFKELRNLWEEGPPTMSLYDLTVALLKVRNTVKFL